MAGMYGCFKGRNSDSAAMASGPPDVMANQEPAEVQEECSGKKKSKFQTFKKFFARKKKKEPSAAGADAGLKASQSSDNVSKTSENNTLTRSEKEKGSGSKISLGSKALSHDSVFVSDSSEANEALGASQDSIHGKVKSLQFQLKQAIRLGSPPSLMCVKKTDDAGTMSEDDGLPCSPPEYTTLHTAMNQAQRNSSISLEGIDSDDDQLSCAASSRAMSPLVVPGDFSQPASPFACLDNSAAKHKLGLRHKACNKRKPASRLEVKTEGDSVVDETLNASITEVLEEQQQRKIEAVSFDALKPKVKREEEEEEEEKEDEKEEEEKEQPQQPRQSLLRDKEEREEGEDESEAEQDVSQSPDTSSTPPEPSLPEEEAPEAQPLPSSEPSSRASSLDSPRVTPETPAGPKEYLLDPPGIAYGAEDNKGGSELALSGEEDEVQENKEEESSFLQEVLSSLKTPLASSSLGVDTEGVVLEMEETTGKEEEEKEEEEEEEAAEIEDGEEVKEEEAEVDEGVGYLAAPSASLVDHTTEEEEEESTPPCRDETLPNEEEAQSEEEEEEAEEEEEEELVVERFSQHDQAEEEAEEEEAKEVELEEINDTLARKTDLQEQKESQEGESEEAIELEKEPEVEEEGQEKREDEEEEEEEEAKLVRGRLEEAEEATEEEKEEAEEVTETFHNAAEEEVGIAMSSQEAAEGADAVVGDDTVCTASQVSDDETPTKEEDQELDKEPEQEENCETVEEGAKVDHSVEKSEEDQPDVDESEVEQADVSCLDAKQVEKDETEATEQEQATVPSKLPSLSLPMPQHETQTQESGTVSPSKTTTIHINLVSPSSEKVTSFFPQPKTPAELQENVTESPSHEQQHLASAGEEQAEAVEQVEEEKQSAPVKDATPTPVEDMANQPSSSSDQSKARFTVTPASQRSQSLTPPSSPPAYVSSAITASGAEEVEAPSKKDPAVNTEPESSPKVELVLSPSRARNAGNAAAKPQSNASPSPSSAKPQTSAAASTEESSVVVEGNPDNPFGVRLRKTSALQRFSSEEENTESPTEPPVQPTSCKPEPPQPISIKPTVSQPTSSKPALPKKPDVHGDSGGKTKRISDAAAARGVSSGSDSPSWITVAKQKQKIYKENSLEEITVKKEEQERKSSLPMYVSSATSREQSNKTAESTSKASLSEINKAPVSVEKEARRALSPPAPVPPQPSKAPSLPCPVPPKPQVPPATTKPPPQPTPHHRSLSPPTPVPVPQKSPSCTSPPSLSKTAASLPSPKTAQPQSTTANSAPFSPRTAPEKPGSRPPGVSAQTPPSPRGLPPPALPQDEPPWMALAKKKAKAWSEMPQIVQ